MAPTHPTPTNNTTGPQTARSYTRPREMKSALETLIERIGDAAASAMPADSVAVFLDGATTGQILVADRASGTHVLRVTYQQLEAAPETCTLIVTGAANLRSALAEVREEDPEFATGPGDGPLAHVVAMVHCEDQTGVDRILALVRSAVERRRKPSGSPAKPPAAGAGQQSETRTRVWVTLTRAGDPAPPAGSARPRDGERFIRSLLH